MKLKVMKFGGTSMGSAKSISQCCKIICNAAKSYNVIVVVSAVSKVTDTLIEMINLANEKKTDAITKTMKELVERHRKILSEFVTGSEFELIYENDFSPHFNELELILKGISYVGDITERTYAKICSFGELLSSKIMEVALSKCGTNSKALSSVELVRAEGDYLEADVDFKKTKRLFKKIVKPLIEGNTVPVITGFLSHNENNEVMLLGRGGSDYTASISAISLDADVVEIWTDVDGIMSADPNVVKNVKIWDKIDINSMAEMSYSGAKVLHPKSITVAIKLEIPVFIKNTFNSDFVGTEITKDSTRGLKGIVANKKQTLIHLADPNILDSVGFINRCSQIFSDANIPIDVCATSEISLTCTIDSKFYTGNLYKSLSKLVKTDVYENIAKICIIGNEISSDPELLKKIMSTISPHKVYTTSIGASFNNVTLIVERKHVDELLKKLHEKLFE